MSISAAGGYSKMQKINQNVNRITNSNKASQQQTVRHLDAVNSKQDQAAEKVVQSAIKIKEVATGAKGVMINVMA